MTNRILLALIVVGLFAFATALSISPEAEAQGELKNLKVLPKSLSKKEVKKIMKSISKATDKSCDDCHELEDFSKDLPMKKKARQMMRMVNTINAKLKKDGFKKRVKCDTCHRGKAKP